jgi:hypothetical protein
MLMTTRTVDRYQPHRSRLQRKILRYTTSSKRPLGRSTTCKGSRVPEVDRHRLGSDRVKESYRTGKGTPLVLPIPHPQPRTTSTSSANSLVACSRHNLHHSRRPPLLLPTIHKDPLQRLHLPHPTQSPRPVSQRIGTLRRLRRDWPRLRPSRALPKRYPTRILCQATRCRCRGRLTSVPAFEGCTRRFYTLVEGAGTWVAEKRGRA